MNRKPILFFANWLIYLFTTLAIPAKKKWQTIGIICILFIFQNQLSAQCTMACNGTTPENASQISMLANCEVVIVPDDILEGADSCMTNKIIEIRADGVGLVVRGEDRVVFNGRDFLDRTMTVKVMDAAGTSCWGYLAVKDKLAPQLECLDTEILCNEDASPNNTGYPIITENCDEDVDITYTDTFIENDCNSPFARTITRTWQVVDASGNTAICEQQIFLRRLDLHHIQFPETVHLECDQSSVDTSITGEPMIGIMPIRNGTICNVHVTYTDQYAPICGSDSYQIQRLWIITDNCTGQRQTSTQNIIILDETPPVLDSPSVLTFGTDNGACTATIQLPRVSATDNCSNDVTISVRTSYGAEGFGVHNNVELGWHTATYTAIDGCGNRATHDVVVLVEDDNAPQVACDDELNISIVGSRRAMLEAWTVSENSIDNCADYLLFSAARMDADNNGDGYPEDNDFVERIEFTCDDIDNTIPVVIRVTQANNPDLFSDCMIQVNVEDKIPPIFDHIEDIYIDCTTDYSDLSIFPIPRVEDNCEMTLETAIEKNINNCGIGEIKRIFTATDRVGNVTTRTQTIFVENQAPFVSDSIDWPEDYTFTNICDPETAPEMLPLAAREPRFQALGCELLVSSYRDEIFEISDDACFKIRRTWQVIDWCNYTPEGDDSNGLFTHTQIIKVLDNIAPEITCLAQVRAGTDGNCSTGTVNIPIPQTDDCSNTITITNDSPYSFDNGADASGIYPVGTTTITFTAHDGCGNRTNCTMNVMVADDKAPTAVCRDGVIGNLVAMNGQGMVMIEAAMLNGNSSDNCTATSDLHYTIRRKRNTAPTPPTTTTLNFNCDELGSQTIEFWVTDAAGNSAFCETIIQIQDNSLVCPSGTDRLPRIGGNIQTVDGEEVEAVMVKVSHDQQHLSANETNVAGNFLFDNVQREQTYRVIPERNQDPANGVSTLDLIIVTKHILGIKNLESPYAMIAADANNSGTISTLDLIAIRKIILQLSDEFPNNTAWRFIPKNHQFTNPNDPCAEVFPEWSDIDYLMNDELQNDFTAIKIGDVNNSAIPNTLVTVDERNTANQIDLITDNQLLSANNTYRIPVYFNEDLAVSGLQLNLTTTSDFEIKNITTDVLTDFSKDNFVINTTAHQINISWNGELHMQKGQALFYLEIAAHQAGELSNILSIKEESLAAELYTPDWTLLPLALVINDSNINTPSLLVQQNIPNPFTEHTTILFEIAKTETVTLRVFDVNGKLLHQSTNKFAKGQHEWSLNRSDISQNGMLYYQLQTANETVTKKMLVLE